jgi:hypothetical protein
VVKSKAAVAAAAKLPVKNTPHKTSAVDRPAVIQNTDPVWENKFCILFCIRKPSSPQPFTSGNKLYKHHSGFAVLAQGSVCSSRLKCRSETKDVAFIAPGRWRRSVQSHNYFSTSFTSDTSSTGKRGSAAQVKCSSGYSYFLAIVGLEGRGKAILLYNRAQQQTQVQEKPVGIMCQAPWILVEAGVVEGRRLTSSGSCKRTSATWAENG